MTVSFVAPPSPTTPDAAGVAAAPAGSPEAAAEFAALVQRHLAGQQDAGDPATPASGCCEIAEVPGILTGPVPDIVLELAPELAQALGLIAGPASEPTESDQQPPEGDATAALTGDPAVVALAGAVAVPVVSSGVNAGASTGVSPVVNAGASAATASSVGTSPASGELGGSAVTATTGPEAASGDATADGAPTGGGGDADPGPGLPTPTGDRPALTAPVASSGTGVGIEGMTPVVAAPVTAPDTGGRVAASSAVVTDQVLPQVARLVSRGDGMHRMTLTLNPAELGEVKIVLTVKAGTVDVTLSAGPAAREALREGSTQLRALLEVAGATTGQVVIRELASTAGANGFPTPQPGQQGAPDGGALGAGARDAASGGPDGDRSDAAGRRPGTGATVSGGPDDDPSTIPAGSRGLDLNL